MRLLFRKILKSTSIKRLAITPRYRRSDELTDSPSSRLEQTLTKPKVFRPIIRPLLAKKQFQEERVFRPFIRPLLAKEQSQEERDCARGSGVIKSIAEKQHFAEKQTANIRAESSVARPLNRTASVSASSDKTSSVPFINSIEGTAHIRRCEQQLGYQFRNTSLLWQALHWNERMKSYPAAMRKESRLAVGNKRLALVGDRVLDLLLTLKWYHTWEDRGELELHLTFIDGDPDRSREVPTSLPGGHFE